MRAWKANGQNVPELDTKPDLDSEALPFWNAFADLTHSRHESGGPIPISEIAAWLDMHGILEQEDRLEYYEIVRALDRASAAIVKKASPPNG